MADTNKFEDWVRNTHKCKTCPQFVRHLCILFGLQQLEAAGIAFKTIVQYPGEIITTEPGEYHEVFNLLPSLAISINCLAPGETPSFFDESRPLAVCNECGLRLLHGKEGFHIRLVDDAAMTAGQKRNAPEPITTARKRGKPNKPQRDWEPAVPLRQSVRTVTKLCSNENSEEAQKQQATLSKMEEHYEHGRFLVTLVLDETMADMVCRLSLAIVSRDAIKQFARAVEHSRRPAEDHKRKPLNQLELEDGDPNCISMARRSKQINATEENTDFNQISNRYDHLQLANCSQALRDELGLGRIPSVTIDEICLMSGSGMHGEGFVVSYHTGQVLAYLPCCRIDQSPFGITEKQYRALADDENGLGRFHCLLGIDYVKSLCAVAEAWYEAMDKGEQFGPDEGGDDVDWDNLQKDEVVEHLQRLTARREE